MKINKVLFLFIFTFSPAMWAQSGDLSRFAGGWLGKGNLIVKGHLSECSVMRMQFEVTATEIVFVSGERVCEGQEEKFVKVTLSYHDGGIFYADQKVGSYDGTNFQTTFRSPDGSLFRNSMRAEGDNLMYEESRTPEGDSTPLISFAGLLIHQN